MGLRDTVRRQGLSLASLPSTRTEGPNGTALFGLLVTGSTQLPGRSLKFAGSLWAQKSDKIRSDCSVPITGLRPFLAAGMAGLAQLQGPRTMGCV